MAAPSPTTAAAAITTHHRVLLPASLSPAPSSTLRIPARAARANRGRICVSAPAAPAASTASPSVSAAVAVEGKPMVLVAEKLGAAGLALVREFAIDCSYGPSYVFEASGGRLRVIGRVGVGIDSVDLAAATEHGCLVVNAPTANTVATAEHDIVVVCSMARNVAQADTSLKSRLVPTSPFFASLQWARMIHFVLILLWQVTTEVT